MINYNIPNQRAKVKNTICHLCDGKWTCNIPALLYNYVVDRCTAFFSLGQNYYNTSLFSQKKIPDIKIPLKYTLVR